MFGKSGLPFGLDLGTSPKILSTTFYNAVKITIDEAARTIIRPESPVVFAMGKVTFDREPFDDAAGHFSVLITFTRKDHGSAVINATMSIRSDGKMSYKIVKDNIAGEIKVEEIEEKFSSAFLFHQKLKFCL